MRRTRLAVVVIIIAAAIARPHGGTAAQSGTIRGRVDLRRAVSPPARRPGVAELGDPSTRGEDDLRRSVVYLESAPRGAFEQVEPGHALMDQRNETFVPHVL